MLCARNHSQRAWLEDKFLEGRDHICLSSFLARVRVERNRAKHLTLELWDSRWSYQHEGVQALGSNYVGELEPRRSAP